MKSHLQTIIWKCAVGSLLLASFSFASFSDYRDRDNSRFVTREAKQFRPDKDVVSVVMREAIPRGGGYTYQYPRENPEPVLTDKYAMEGALSMEIELIASDYSGVAICIAGSVDLTPYLEEGVLEFWIKGAKGGENALFVLVDDGDGRQEIQPFPYGFEPVRQNVFLGIEEGALVEASNLEKLFRLSEQEGAREFVMKPFLSFGGIVQGETAPLRLP